MEVTPEEVADMIREFGKDEITFPQVNLRQIILAYSTYVALVPQFFCRDGFIISRTAAVLSAVGRGSASG